MADENQSDTPLSLPPIRYPQWMDAPYIAAACRLEVRKVNPTAAGGVPVLPSNPMRFAVGFKLSAAAAGSAQVAPHREPANFGWPIAKTDAPLWFTASLFGTAVVGQWYVTGTITDEVMVYELILN